MIHPEHQAEWRASAIADSLTKHNLRSIGLGEGYEFLTYAIEDRKNDGRLRQGVMDAYDHTEKGGWWCAGVDITTGDRTDWGCLKPNEPRKNKEGKIIKYEHPPKTNTRTFALRIPYEIGQKIADRFGLAEEYKARAAGAEPNAADRDFWQWALSKKEIPLVITEGAKKTASLLSAGYLAIGLPGIWGAYRQDKDEHYNKVGEPYLIEEVKPLIKGRDVVFAFDQDEKPKTIFLVSLAQKRTANLMASQGAMEVSTLSWDSKKLPYKGVDDLIAAEGVEVFDRVFYANMNRVKTLEPKENSIEYLFSGNPTITAAGGATIIKAEDLRKVRFEANLHDAKLGIVPENMIYCRTAKMSEFQNLPPPTLKIESLNYTYHCWAVHDSSPQEIAKLQSDLYKQVGESPTYGVPMPGIIDMATGYISQTTEISDKSYSLEHLRQSIPSRDLILKPLQQQQQEHQEPEETNYGTTTKGHADEREPEGCTR